MACLKQQHEIAWRESVDNRRFPGSSARSWIHHNWTSRLEDLAHTFEYFRAQACELVAAMVNDRMIRGPERPIGTIRCTANLAKVSASLTHFASAHPTRRP